jgi:ubiquitin-conjugating enzyme E2 W
MLELHGAPGTLYDEEVFVLRFRFTEKYPMEAPEVIFIGAPPVHPHVYSNGHICLSILYDQWSPALTVHGVCLSILSMLSSSTVKARPSDDERYVKTVGQKSPKLSRWQYHDDSV